LRAHVHVHDSPRNRGKSSGGCDARVARRPGLPQRARGLRTFDGLPSIGLCRVRPVSALTLCSSGSVAGVPGLLASEVLMVATE
jgi:hypothetical protein